MGKAGSIASIDSAVKDIIIAIRRINSMNPICVLFLAGADFGLEVDTFKKLDFVLLEGIIWKNKEDALQS
jgi:hypothetical protein